MNRIDIERVKADNPIERIVGRYVKLSVRGHKATGLCPFHDDHHPSLQVDLRKQTFVCYACGEKGDVIEFVEKIDRCTFPQALEKLGYQPERAPRTRVLPPLDTETYQRTRQYQAEHDKFLGQLMPYVVGDLDLSLAYLDFEVGLAPQSICHPMRGRVIFPIRDEERVLKGFAGREDSSRPSGAKYLNTPTSEGFFRSRILYGMYRAGRSMLEQGNLYLVEGYKDVIAMHAAGITNCVGICGTELTEDQISLFLAEVDHVFLVMDGDEPGRKAAAKIRERLERDSLRTDMILLPEGHDPDSLFREIGREKFADYIYRRSTRLYHWEYLLISACMYWPDATISRKGESVPFLSFLSGLIEAGETQFYSPDHSRIFERLIQGVSWNEMPEELLEVARDRMECCRESLNVRLAEWMACGRDRKEALELLMQEMLFNHTEGDLTYRMKRLANGLYYNMDAEDRPHLLRSIEACRDLLNFISGRLNRPAALDDRWLTNREIEGLEGPFY